MIREYIDGLELLIFIVSIVWFCCNTLPIIFIIKYRKLVNLYFLLGAILGHIASFIVAYLLYSIMTKSINFQKFTFIWITPLALIPTLASILILSYINRHTIYNNTKSVKVGFLLFFIVLSVVYSVWFLR